MVEFQTATVRTGCGNLLRSRFGAAASGGRKRDALNGAGMNQLARVFRRVGVFLAALVLGVPSAAPDASARHPSVLLVTVDTLRADHLGAYGHPENPSRHFDALAKRGVLYERAIAASARTAPSHASIMTSRYVREHSIRHGNGQTRLGDELTLARVLAAHGYRTAAFVSNAVLARRTGLDAGFEVYDDELADYEVNRGIFERIARSTTDRAVEWLYATDTPFFLWVHYNDPHGPYTPPESFLEGLTGPVPPTAPDAEDAPLPALDVQRGWKGVPAYQVLPGLARPSQYRAHYTGEVRYADHALGRLVRSAEEAAGEAGLVIVVTADHGESLGEEGFYFSHGYATTPDLVHVPFLVAAPGLAPGRSSDVVHHVDVMPTILELVGLKTGFVPSGLALGPYWRKDQQLPDRVVFADVGAEVSAYRADRFERFRLHEDIGDTKAGTRKTYRWSSDAVWKEVSPDRIVQQSVNGYLAKKGPLLYATEPSLGLQERLRALGYVEPDGGTPTQDTR